jgi:hypothetical protein
MYTQHLHRILGSSVRVVNNANPYAPSSSPLMIVVQRRFSYGSWQHVLTKKLDRSSRMTLKDGLENNENLGDKLGKNSNHYIYEDWDDIIKHDLGNEHEYLRHVKPTEARRRLKSKILYDSSMTKIEDLASYIQFVQDHKEDFRGKKF